MRLPIFFSIIFCVEGFSTTQELKSITKVPSSPNSFVFRSSRRRPHFVTSFPKSELLSTHTTEWTTISQDVFSLDDKTTLEMESNEQFDWFKAWYPVVPIEILDPEIPHKFEILGESVVVWNDAPLIVKEKKGSTQDDGKSLFRSKKKRPKGAKRDISNGTWRAFIDQCPHRKVPLSEGRVEDDGTLLCSYHGWRFEGSGKCVDIPQLVKEEQASETSSNDRDPLKLLFNNPRTSCNSFPTQVINGILFVWPSTGTDASLEAMLTPVVYRPAPVDPSKAFIGPWNFRELPYGADFFIENVVDPAHVQVSHHNVVGSRYNSQYIEIKSEKPLTKNGFSFISKNNDISDPGCITFEAPNLVTIDAMFGNGAKQTLELYVTPSRPGFCYHVGRMVIEKDSSGKMPNLLKQFTFPMPIWLNHVLTSAFLNQDALFLHSQERLLAQTEQYASYSIDNNTNEPYKYDKALALINADQGVLRFRTWLRQLAGGMIPYKYNPTMPPIDREVVFDQWNGHTKHCKICQNALKNLKIIRAAAFTLATCVAVLKPIKFPSLFARNVPNLMVSLLLAGLGFGLNKLIGLFYRYEFSHAHND